MLNKKTLAELAGYGSLTIALAVGVTEMVVPKPPPEAQPLVARSAEDARRLGEYVGWIPGRPMLVEFMDFECPPCRGSWSALKSGLQNHPGVRYQAVNFPLVIHANAFPAAVAVQVAKAHGLYARAFDDLFSGKTVLSKDYLNGYLSSHGVPAIVGTDNAARFEKEVHEDMAFGESLRISATPTLFLISADGKLTQVNSIDRLTGLLG